MIKFKQPKVLDCWIPAAISAAGALIGGRLASNASSKQSGINYQNEQKLQAWAQKFNWEMAERDRALQREFAQHGVQWKAEDARAAGLDPIAAMGSQTIYSNAAIPVRPNPVYNEKTDNSWMERAGQNIGTALGRFLTKEQVNHGLEMQKLQRERANLENDNLLIRNMQLNGEALNYQTQVAVPAPSSHTQIIDGQNDAVQVEPDRVTRHQDGHKAGVHAMKQYRLGAPLDDGSIPIYSAIEQEAGDAMDADLPTKARYNAREWGKVVKSWAGRVPKQKPAIKKKGYHIEWNRLYGQWMFIPNRKEVRIKRRFNDPRDKGKYKNPTFKRYKIY